MSEKPFKHKKVGIMGGTFNPIHNGHLTLAYDALKSQNLDEILFIPSGVSWLKANQNVLPAGMRLEMTALAIEGNEKFTLSEIEIRRNGNSYSYETVLELKKEHPDTDYYFIMGADSVMSINQWVHPEILMEKCTLLAAVRDDCDKKKLKEHSEMLTQIYGARIILLPMTAMDISSTQIRTLRQHGQSIAHLVPAKVEQYILEHQLYL